MPQTPTYGDLDGKVAFVTGGSRGIGRAVCAMLVDNNVRVAVVARGGDDVAEVVRELEQRGGTAIGITADCTDFDSVQSARLEAETHLGFADILMPFAGGLAARTPVQEISEEDWRFVIDANLTATFLTVKAFIPGLIERRRGAIVTMASNAARTLDLPLVASYAAAKAAILGFTRHVALELAPHGVRANAVAPATLATERVRRVLGDAGIAQVAGMSPLGRIGEADDAARAALFLASDAASWLTGITLDVAGGRVMM